MDQSVYCARCGSAMERRLVDDHERDVCPACGFILYRNPVPAVGVVVALGGKVVLVRRRYEPRAGCWALPAGFMELGESAEEAAARECHEETGLLVRVDHLLGVYSFGEGQSTGLLIVYAATATGGELVAADDATEVGVYSTDVLPAPMAFSTHLQAIERWRREARALEALQMPAEQAQGFYVRYAGHSDIQAVLALLLDDQARADDRGVAAEALLHDWLADPDRPVLVAELDGRIGGVALLHVHQSLRGWYATLDDLVVGDELRRRGLGRALVEFAAALAAARGCSILQMAQPDLAPGTQEFLAACGFDTGTTLARRLD